MSYYDTKHEASKKLLARWVEQIEKSGKSENIADIVDRITYIGRPRRDLLINAKKAGE